MKRPEVTQRGKEIIENYQGLWEQFAMECEDNGDDREAYACRTVVAALRDVLAALLESEAL